MNAREFVEGLYRKHYLELEGPIVAVRKAMAELDPRSPAFVALMQRQAMKELKHAEAFTKAVLQYPELDPHERADIAEQAAEEFRHYALLRDFLERRGEAVEDSSADAYDAYFSQFLTGGVKAFRLCNVAEKSVVLFLRHLRDVSVDPEVRKLAHDIVADEEDHEEQVVARLAQIAEDEGEREFLERYFIQSWSSQKAGVFREAEELGIDTERVLADFSESGGR